MIPLQHRHNISLRSFLGPTLLLVLVALFSPYSVAANYYKWVDAEGVTHYSQHPPTDQSIQKEKITVSDKKPANATQAISALEKNRKTLLEAADKRKLDLDKGMAEAERQTAIRKNCDVAQSNLTQLKEHPRVREEGEDGEFRYLTEDEHQKRKDDNVSYLEDNCR